MFNGLNIAEYYRNKKPKKLNIYRLPAWACIVFFAALVVSGIELTTTGKIIILTTLAATLVFDKVGNKMAKEREEKRALERMMQQQAEQERAAAERALEAEKAEQ